MTWNTGTPKKYVNLEVWVLSVLTFWIGNSISGRFIIQIPVTMLINVNWNATLIPSFIRKKLFWRNTFHFLKWFDNWHSYIAWRDSKEKPSNVFAIMIVFTGLANTYLSHIWVFIFGEEGTLGETYIKELSFHEHLHDEILYYTTFPAFKMLAMPVSSLVNLIPFEDLFDFPMTESSINIKVYILDTMCLSSN